GTEVPVIGRKEPGPAHDPTRSDGLHRDRLPTRSLRFQADLTAPDEVEAVGNFALAKHRLSSLELSEHCAPGEDLHMHWAHAAHKWVRGHRILEVDWVHRRSIRSTPTHAATRGACSLTSCSWVACNRRISTWVNRFIKS